MKEMFSMLHSASLNKNNLDDIFDCFASQLEKNHCSNVINIYLVGGGAIMLNFDYRLSTIDFDALYENNKVVQEAINNTAIKKNLPKDWLNQDFVSTPSYSPKIIELSVLRCSYRNLVFVYTLEPVYLIAMKLKSSRPTGGDLDDIIKMIYELRLNGSDLTYRKVLDAYQTLYKDSSNTIPYFFEKAKLAFEAPEDEMNTVLGKLKGYDN